MLYINLIEKKNILKCQVLKFIFQYYNEKLPYELMSLFETNDSVHRAANNFSKPVGHNVRWKLNSVGPLQKPIGHNFFQQKHF